jgi:hypothetical protein
MGKWHAIHEEPVFQGFPLSWQPPRSAHSSVPLSGAHAAKRQIGFSACACATQVAAHYVIAAPARAPAPLGRVQGTLSSPPLPSGAAQWTG